MKQLMFQVCESFSRLSDLGRTFWFLRTVSCVLCEECSTTSNANCLKAVSINYVSYIIGYKCKQGLHVITTLGKGGALGKHKVFSHANVQAKNVISHLLYDLDLLQT